MAAVDNIDTQLILVETYEHGSGGVEKNKKEAFTLCLRAAKEGHPRAIRLVVDMYSTGRGTEKNNDEAARWYSKTIQQAQPDLSIGGVDAPHEVSQSRSGNIGSMSWYQMIWQKSSASIVDKTGDIDKRSIDNGLALARCRYELGMMYLMGEGGDQNESDAVEWLTKAADYGLPEAQCSLGFMYQKGRGVAQDKNKSFALYTQAAVQGYPPTQYVYGCHLVAEKIDIEAVKWFTHNCD
ncbi:hypothetical protein BGZ73_008694 [Actinomortierella ambigua]|nr:hypothetical protein BGZ73_008694 [Actinomortierella ambigua]